MHFLTEQVFSVKKEKNIISKHFFLILLIMMVIKCAVQKIPMPLSQRVFGNSKGEGGGGHKSLKEKYGDSLTFDRQTVVDVNRLHINEGTR